MGVLSAGSPLQGVLGVPCGPDGSHSPHPSELMHPEQTNSHHVSLNWALRYAEDTFIVIYTGGAQVSSRTIMPDNIEHVVYLLLENQSFDRLLGCFRQIYPDLEGLNAPGQPPYTNSDDKGVIYTQKPTEAKQVTLDPKHEARFVLEQLKDNNGGFVLDFARNYPGSTTQQRQEIMGYYPLGFLLGLHTLAREFTICDHWFSSLPGPTWPNRFFALTGTCHGQALMPEGWKDPQLATYFDQTQDTIFDRLSQGGRSWHVYYYDFPSSLLLDHQRRPENLIH